MIKPISGVELVKVGISPTEPVSISKVWEERDQKMKMGSLLAMAESSGNPLPS